MVVKFIVKCALVVFNVVFLLASLVVIGVGVGLLVVFENPLPDDVPVDLSVLNIVPIIIIVLGSIIFLISFSGCCGALTETRCLVITYATSLVIIVALNIYMATATLSKVEHYQNTVETYLNDIFTSPTYNMTFHTLEIGFKCCGTTGPNSYDGVYERLPPTCCPGLFESCYSTFTLENCLCEKYDAFNEGCSVLITQFIGLIGNSLGYGFIGVIVVGVCALILCIYLIKTINKRKTEDRMRLLY